MDGKVYVEVKGAGCRKKTGKDGGICVQLKGCAYVCIEKTR